MDATDREGELPVLTVDPAPDDEPLPPLRGRTLVNALVVWRAAMLLVTIVMAASLVSIAVSQARQARSAERAAATVERQDCRARGIAHRPDTTVFAQGFTAALERACGGDDPIPTAPRP